MSDASEINVAFAEAREDAIAKLAEQFANDDIQIEELEARVMRVHDAGTIAALDEILGLPSLGPAKKDQTLARAPARGELQARERVESRWVFAVFSGARRTGNWTVGRSNRVVAIMGGAVVDLREVDLSPGEEVLVDVLSIFGGAHILVPPHARVTTSVSALFGGVEELNQGAPAGAPRIRVNGLAIFGGIHVESRLLGENSGAARKSLREEKKALRDARQKQLERGR